MRAVTTYEQMESVLRVWEWGKWARSAWGQPLKPPGWVKEIKTQDREKDLKRIIGTISDDYGSALDSYISALPEEFRDTLVNLYVNLLPAREAAKDQKTTTYRVRNNRDVALGILYGALHVSK